MIYHKKVYEVKTSKSDFGATHLKYVVIAGDVDAAISLVRERDEEATIESISRLHVDFVLVDRLIEDEE